MAKWREGGRDAASIDAAREPRPRPPGAGAGAIGAALFIAR